MKYVVLTILLSILTWFLIQSIDVSIKEEK